MVDYKKLGERINALPDALSIALSRAQKKFPHRNVFLCVDEFMDEVLAELEKTGSVYVISHPTEYQFNCDACGKAVNSGYVDICDPKQDIYTSLDLLGLHALVEHGVGNYKARGFEFSDIVQVGSIQKVLEVSSEKEQLKKVKTNRDSIERIMEQLRAPYKTKDPSESFELGFLIGSVDQDYIHIEDMVVPVQKSVGSQIVISTNELQLIQEKLSRQGNKQIIGTINYANIMSAFEFEPHKLVRHELAEFTGLPALGILIYEGDDVKPAHYNLRGPEDCWVEFKKDNPLMNMRFFEAIQNGCDLKYYR